MPPRLALLLACALAAGADDVATVRARVLAELLWAPGAPLATPAEAAAWAASLRANGTWPDIVYDDPADRTNWKAAAHTARVQALAAAVARPGGALFRDAASFGAARRALAGWLALDPPCDNWWWTILQSPQTLSASYLLLSLVGDAAAPPFPTADELELGLTFMYRAAWWNASLGYEVTGANLAWMMQTQLTRGVLPTAPNASALAQGFARLWEEVRVVNDTNDGANQGIQVDGSYHMHSAQLQVGSYGQDYLSEVLLFSGVAAGTAYAMPRALAGVLCAYVADGMAWLTSGRAIDWAASGRQVARPGVAAQMLVSVNLTRLDELAGACPDAAAGAAVAAFAARARGDAGAPALRGNRHFWTSDHMAHRRAGWAANLHMRSLRTRSPECGNGENLRGEHMGNGLLNLVGEGGAGAGADAGGVAEYADIFPLLDWHELNGVTADVDIPVPDCADVAACCWTAEVLHNSTAWVGGASDGAFGVAAMDTRTHALSARRAWFFLDRAVVALTADATDASASAVRTTLASRLLWGPVAAGWGNGSTTRALPWGNLSLPLGGGGGGALEWVAAVGHAWLPWLPAAGPPPAAGARLSAGRRCGAWQDIGASTGEVCNDTLTLALDHGAGLGGARFGYALLPNVSADEAPAAAAAARGLAVVNGGAADGGVQAVADAHARAAGAAFWAPAGGAVTLGAGGAWPLALAADAACLAVYAEDGTGGATLAVSAPAPGGQAVALTVGRDLAPGAGCPATPAPGGGSTLVARLPPAGDFQGQSVVFRCRLQ